MSRRPSAVKERLGRISFRVTDDAGNKNILSIIQGGGYGIPEESVEVAYFTIRVDKRGLGRGEFPVISFVDFVELENILRDVRLGATPEQIKKLYVDDFELFDRKQDN